MGRVFIFLMLFVSFCSAIDVDDETNYLVLTQNVDNINLPSSAGVIFFVSIKDSNNFAGVNFRTVVLEAGLDSLEIVISGTMKDSLDIGAFIPIQETVSFDVGLTKVQKRNIIDSRFTELNTEQMDIFYSRYDFYGFQRTVP